jgi:GH15 family glucan-1,4-alpha-glucosidase
MARSTSPYLPIADYGAIGNLRTVALVGRNGSIDWCCLPALAGASVFGALLDHQRGGRFRVAPARACRSEQRYRGDTCVLETHFVAEGGDLLLTDFMPLRGTIIGAHDPETEPSIYRLLHCTGGEVEVEVAWSPRFDYARAETRVERIEGGFLAHAAGERLVLGGALGEAEIAGTGAGPEVRARFSLRAGEARALVVRYSADDVRHAPQRADPRVDLEGAVRLLRDTSDTWVRWAHDNEERPTSCWAGEWNQAVTRSELTLKLLTHPDTGAIAAAPTTSLPEDIGGVRNWDYRYSWVRDSSFVVQALHSLGHGAEAQDFLNFVERAARRGSGRDHGLQIMYGLHGETDLPEHTLEHLEGYRGSRPVRVGNAAAGQRQHDTYGELIDAAYELARRGEELEPDDWSFLSQVAERACHSWREADSGIWEMRGPERHYTHSKVMVWVALDRAVRMADRWGLEGNVERWRQTRDMLYGLILRRGYDEEVGAFTLSFGSRALDAATLRFPVQEFISTEDPRMQSTIDRILERLTENGLVYRYRIDDGLPGDEGAFGLCTFWLVDALILSDRLDEAQEIFEGIMRRANHVGLYSEQIDPASGEFLGNFPQAFTHLGVINSALYLARAEERPIPERARLLGNRRRGGDHE